jgi:hypothetical protein
MRHYARVTTTLSEGGGNESDGVMAFDDGIFGGAR